MTWQASLKTRFFSLLGRGMKGAYSAGFEKWARRVPFGPAACRALYRKLRPREVVVVPVLGRPMKVDPRDMGVSYRLLTVGTLDPQQTDLFRCLIRSGDVVLDIGANIGYYTFLAADLVGAEGTVIAFEPAEQNYRLLQGTLSLNRYTNVVPFRKAVSDQSGKAALLKHAENWGAHRLFNSGNLENSVLVETTTLDDFFGNRNERVDAIKIDAEGAEFAVLRGARGVLRANPDLMLFAEFNPKVMQAFGDSPDGYLRELLRQGFEITYIDEQERKTKRLSAEQVESFSQGMAAMPIGSDYVNLLCVRGRKAERLTGRYASFAEDVRLKEPA